MRKVPKLLPSYIERDAWTKLNVAPAKIMQVSQFSNLSSLRWNEVISQSGHQEGLLKWINAPTFYPEQIEILHLMFQAADLPGIPPHL